MKSFANDVVLAIIPIGSKEYGRKIVQRRRILFTYHQIIDTYQYQYEGCHIDQVLGQSFGISSKFTRCLAAERNTVGIKVTCGNIISAPDAGQYAQDHKDIKGDQPIRNARRSRITNDHMAN